MSSVIPIQTYTKSQLGLTDGLQPALDVACCTQFIYSKHNFEALITFSLCTVLVCLHKLSLKTMRIHGVQHTQSIRKIENR